jgi:hypothetical protein
MLPKKEHIKQIDNFFDLLKETDDKLESSEISDVEKMDLSILYYRLTKLWNSIDDSTEKLRDELENLKRKHKLKI